VLPSRAVTSYAEISAEPNLFKKIHAMTDSTESEQEISERSVCHESEGALDTSLCQGTTSVVP
jgi:hypothetical protein